MSVVSKDKRGFMELFNFLGKDFYFAFTRKGFGRGGEYHPITQYNSVISGKMMFRMIIDGEDETKILISGQSIVIPANIAHVAIAMEDSITVEWHSGKLPPFEQKKIYEPWRKLCFRD
jgi:hypothetical protein